MARIIFSNLKVRVQMEVKYPKVSTIRQHIAVYIIKFGRWLFCLPFNIKIRVVEVK